MRGHRRPPADKGLTSSGLRARISEKVTVEVMQREFTGKYVCRLVSMTKEFIYLQGLQAQQKPFFLPIGTPVRLGFALEDGWAESAGRVVAWSGERTLGQLMVRCGAVAKVTQRRRHTRVDSNLKVTCLPDGASPLSGEARNLSKAGICVFFKTPLPQREAMAVRLFPEKTDPIQFQGVVVWTSPITALHGACLAGMTVTPLSEAHGRRYKNLLSRLRQRALEAAKDNHEQA